MIHMHAAPTPPKLLKFKHPSAKYRRKKRTLCRDRNAAFGGSPCARCRHILEALAGLTPAASRIDKSSNLEHVSVLALHGLHPWPTSPEPKGTRRLGPSWPKGSSDVPDAHPPISNFAALGSGR